MKRFFMLILALLMLLVSSVSYAHSGRTDSNGGHKDNNNVSGLGSYHYHCGGHPAHLHPGGVCPYASGGTSSKTNTKQTSATSTPPPEVHPPVQITDSNGQPTQLHALGIVHSQIKQGKTTTTVATNSLMFADDITPAFGAIYAPNTGKASLRQSASNNAKTLRQCQSGAIVYIVTPGDEFSLILYKDELGYIRNSALSILPSAPADFTQAVLSLNGKTNGKDRINVRLTPDGPIIGKFATGTPIVIVGQDANWYEIEVEGYRGFVMMKLVTLSSIESRE